MIQFPDELKNILEATDFEDGSTKLVSVEYLEDVLNLIVELWDDLDNVPRQRWKFECKGIKDYKFSPHNSVGLEIVSDHPLLYPYNDMQSELYFNDSTSKLKELLADLIKAHLHIAGEWFPPQKFIHQLPYITKDFTFGLLAKGPDVILYEYSKILEQYKVSANIINQREPKYWDGLKWVESKKDNVVLFIGEHYIITNSIYAKRV